ncbi:MAG: Unknown protein [uncultured Sulfurovum sp.]|uniref:Uncharacterized protein n=1 Tax=uncultured Sulfurovum sp. TaxID=269237 RepID=A0A6S6SYN6_9BACT|nr:MAG: Unknown protein [uncultured Sulfurovum sp.]
MKEKNYSLDTMLSTITKYNGTTAKKRLIFDQFPLGGIGAKWVILFCLSLPVLLFAGIFNDTIFNMLGIAQAIIFFVVFLSMVMILIIAVVFINNNKVVRQLGPSWKTIFPDIDLKLALASGGTPYKDFLMHYTKALEKNLKGEPLEEYMKNAFTTMQEENAYLLAAMNNARNER